MTPRNPWRRTWREKVAPVLWLLLACVIAGGAAGIKSAHADPLSPGEAYAATHSPDICMMLDAHPTVAGVRAAVNTLHNEGLTEYDAGIAIAASVLGVCVIHVDLLYDYVGAEIEAGRFTDGRSV